MEEMGEDSAVDSVVEDLVVVDSVVEDLVVVDSVVEDVVVVDSVVEDLVVVDSVVEVVVVVDAGVEDVVGGGWVGGDEGEAAGEAWVERTVEGSVEEDSAEEDSAEEDFSDHVLHQLASIYPEHVSSYLCKGDYIYKYNDQNLLPKLHRDQH
jgi:hypothetical protein